MTMYYLPRRRRRANIGANFVLFYPSSLWARQIFWT